uniref:Uncharacterized protein n=1 Tax=Pristionchus pacificus TaxID=54126 RepID=A0A2A6B843_PRIPA
MKMLEFQRICRPVYGNDYRNIHLLSYDNKAFSAQISNIRGCAQKVQMQLHSTLSEDGTLESEESHLFREDRVLLELCEKWTIDSEKSCE